MHAEMRVLAIIEDQLKDSSNSYSNYIGISKLCCLDCHAMIYAVNNAVGYKNDVEIRGAHNVEHTGNWNAPFGITGNPSSTNKNEQLKPPKVSTGSARSTRTSPDEPFVAAVVEQFNVARKQAGFFMKGDMRVAGAKDVSEDPNLSQTSSEEEGENYYEKYCLYLSSMEETLNLRKEVCSDDKDLLEEIEIIRLGLKVCKERILERICKTELAQIKGTNMKEVDSNFRMLTGKLDDKEGELLKKFLRSPAYSGKKINMYFTKISFEITPQKEPVKRRRGSRSHQS
jgi:hypothetical protein